MELHSMAMIWLKTLIQIEILQMYWFRKEKKVIFEEKLKTQDKTRLRQSNTVSQKTSQKSLTSKQLVLYSYWYLFCSQPGGPNGIKAQESLMQHHAIKILLWLGETIQEKNAFIVCKSCCIEQVNP